MLNFYWKIYKRNKERKQKAEEERKKKAKAAKGKKKKGRNNSIAMKNVQQRSSTNVQPKTSTTGAVKGASIKRSGTKRGEGDQKADEIAAKAEADATAASDAAFAAGENAMKAEAAMDMAVGKLGAFGMMGKGIMQTVPEEITSPVSGSVNQDDDELKQEDEEDENFSRAGINTRENNRRGVKKDETFNEDLDMTMATVPQVSILDTEGKNMNLDDDDSDEEQRPGGQNGTPSDLLQLPGDEDTRPASVDSQEARINAMLE